MREKERSMLAVVILVSAVMFLYSALYTINNFNNFLVGFDGGISSYTIYYYLHFPVSTPFQYLVYGQHIIPETIVFIPIFYLFQTPLTLQLLQSFYVALTGIIIYLGAKDLLKNKNRAFLLFIFFMFNPETLTFFIGPYHPESAIMLFAFLTFYFYMKKKFRPFLISLIIFVFEEEFIPFLALFLAAGLFAYEYFEQGKKPSSLEYKYIATIVLCAVLGLVFFLGFEPYMQGQYSMSTNNVPPTLQAYPFISSQLGAITQPATTQTQAIGTASKLSSLLNTASTLYGSFIIILGYGVSAVFALPSLILFLIPWIGGAFITKGQSFFGVNEQYLSFALYGTMISAILGCMLADQKKGIIAKLMLKINRSRYEKHVGLMNTVLTLALFAAMMAVYPAFLLLNNAILAINYPYNFLLTTSPAQQAYAAQINSMIALIPANSTLMTNDYMLPHLISFRYWEPFEPKNSSASYFDYFIPKYILLDLRNEGNGTTVNLTQLESMISTKYNCTGLNGTAPGCNYYVLARNGTAVLFEARN